MKALLTAFLISIGLAQAAVPPTSAEKSYYPFQNLLTNPGFESGKTGWSASGGTFTITTTSANVSTGAQAATWDSSAASQTFRSSSITVPPGWYGANGVLRCRIQTPSGTATHTIGAWDGTTYSNATTITSSSSYVSTSVNFIWPSSGTLAIQISSVNANEPSINIDDCYYGLADNIGTVAQAQFIGSGYYAATASCLWTRSSTSLGAFSTTAACPAPTVEANPGPGTISTTDADLPQFTVNNLTPGIYRVQFTGFNDGGSSGTEVSYAISDGTNTRGYVSQTRPAGNSTWFQVEAFFTYTNIQSSVTFSMYGAATSGSVQIGNSANNNRLNFSLIKFPSSSEIAYEANSLPNSWSGYHDTTCSWAVTSTSYADFTADASCNLTERTNRNFGTVSTSGSVKPAITFNPVVGRRYWVCATASLFPGSAVNAAVRLWDGTTTVLEVAANTGSNRTDIPLCGIYNAATTPATLSLQAQSDSGAVNISSSRQSQSSLEWAIFDLDQSFPAPILVGPRSYVVMSGGNGYGSTANRRRRFTTVLENVGTAITLTQSSVNGDTFTINSNGIYAMSYNDGYSGGAFEAGITRNSNGTTSVAAVPDADLLAYYTSPGGSALLPMSTTRYLTAGTVIEATTDGTADRTTAKQVRFSITKVSD